MKDISVVVIIGKWGGVHFYRGESFVEITLGFISVSLWEFDVVEFIHRVLSTTPPGEIDQSV